MIQKKNVEGGEEGSARWRRKFIENFLYI